MHSALISAYAVNQAGRQTEAGAYSGRGRVAGISIYTVQAARSANVAAASGEVRAGRRFGALEACRPLARSIAAGLWCR
jgi:hypothetical protein